MAQPIWSAGCPTWAQKRTKNIKHTFLALFWAHVGQPDNHIGSATLMLFAPIYSTNPRTNSWKFRKKILRIGGVENLSFFWVGHFEFYFFKKNFFLLHLNIYRIAWIFRFWWLPWVPAQNNTCLKICNTVDVYKLGLKKWKLNSFEFKFDDTRLSSYYKNKIGLTKKNFCCVLTLLCLCPSGCLNQSHYR